MNTHEKQSRDISLDVIRGFALFCVISVHFFLNSKYYNNLFIGQKMYIATIVRSFFMICVPLFLLLSGYLLSKRELSMNYYKKILSTIGTYILASLACGIFARFYLSEDINIIDLIKGTLNFKTAPYSWYVEMYLGLFVLIPFLNIIWNNLANKQQKLFLIIIMILVSMSGSIINVYNFDSLSWWKYPGMSESYQKIIPFYWFKLYPFTYYFIGCYLKEFKPKLKLSFNFFLIIVTTFIFGSYSFWRNYKLNRFIWGAWAEYYSIFVLILSVLVFLFLHNINYTKVPSWCKYLIIKISKVSLCAYLISYIFDSVFYPILNDHIPKISSRFIYFLPTVIIIYICSILLSVVIDYLQQWLGFIFNKLTKKFKHT